MNLSKIDLRRLRVSIEVDGQLKIYENLAIKVSGKKGASPKENNCDIEISNLTADTRNYILTETSPFNKNKTRKRVIVEAGRVSTGLTRVFVGEIISASPTQPPDIGLKMKAQTGAFYKGTLLAKTGKAVQNVKELAETVAKDLDATLDFQAENSDLANFSYTGSALGQVDKLNQCMNVEAFLDDENLVVKNLNKPLTGRTRILRSDTGLIGIPEVTERGVRVKFLFDAETVVGGKLTLESSLNPSLDGDYEIYTLAFDLTNRDTNFYYVAEARRL